MYRHLEYTCIVINTIRRACRRTTAIDGGEGGTFFNEIDCVTWLSIVSNSPVRGDKDHFHTSCPDQVRVVHHICLIRLEYMSTQSIHTT